MSRMRQRDMRSAFEKVKGEDIADRRDSLDVWGEPCGWCSACGRDGIIVAHIGVRGRCDVALCDRCVDRMHEAITFERRATTSDPSAGKP